MSGARVLDFVARENQGASPHSFLSHGVRRRREGGGQIGHDQRHRGKRQSWPSCCRRHRWNAFATSLVRRLADIVKAIRPKGPYSRIAVEAVVLHGRSEGDEIRGNAAIAAIAAEAAVVSPEDRERDGRVARIHGEPGDRYRNGVGSSRSCVRNCPNPARRIWKGKAAVEPS